MSRGLSASVFAGSPSLTFKSGHQPLSNEDGSIWIVFNGEIYNYQELRTLLLGKGHVFKTQTDTEVIVHLYEELGPHAWKSCAECSALPSGTRNAKTLFLARDRVGIKPLYYHLTDDSLVFASEIKAILADPSVKREIAPELIDRFLTFLYVPGEETLLKGIQKLAPGHYLSGQGRPDTIRQYWDLHFSESSRGKSIEQAEADLLASAVGNRRLAHDRRCAGRRSAERRSRFNGRAQPRRGRDR